MIEVSKILRIINTDKDYVIRILFNKEDLEKVKKAIKKEFNVDLEFARVEYS